MAWTLYRSAEQAIDTISKTVLGKAAHHLRNTVQDHFSHARLTLNAIAFDSILQQGTSASDFRFSSALFDIKDHLWTALKLFPESGRRVFFCSKDGHYVGISRIDSQQYEIGLRTSGNENWTVYSSTGPRDIGDAIRKETYDPRNQRWYRLAVNHESEVWYAHNPDSEMNESLITLAKPIYSKSRSLLGVASTELSLSKISQALQFDQVSPHGVSFIVERSGKVIASSEINKSPAEDMMNMVSFPAAAGHSQLLRDAYAAFINRRASTGIAKERSESFDFVSGDEKAHATVVELRDNGLDWLLIAAAPHADFSGGVRNTMMRYLAIGLVAMMLALLLGFLILRSTLSDIRRLAAAVKNIGRGESFQTLNIERGDEIGQLAKSFQQIERNLRTDKLTSVLNRDSLIAQIDFHCSVGKEVGFLRFSILFIDLDGFKQINDLYGHDEGDRVLSEAAQRLREAIRKEDAVARFGGDEFVVYLHAAGDYASIAAICEKIRISLEEPICLRDGGGVRVGASIGYSCFPEDGLNSDVLLRIADNRMFYDKKMRKSTLQLPLQ
ncbi:diguanylate cyclase [Oxalobacteraceae bacterium R-40]|uniref:Diguanylate cyclase n=1 Tax=Keguizhuia sedimenti TaxID=3064264 RepID=A0ABU1BSD8_9BURK|nr:diguanylate cyclase [Oxalobacteraceae bacterium R-40]